MRKVIAVALSLAVQVAALTAPLVHAHPDEHPSDHHEGGAVHAHWAGHASHSHHSDGPELGTADRDRAVFLNAFIAVAASPVADPGVTLTAFELSTPAERPSSRGIDVVRSHDPPLLESRSTRAPPTFLS